MADDVEFMLAIRNANWICLCCPTVFRRNVFFEMTVVAQSCVAQKNNSPKRLSPNWFFAQPSAPLFIVPYLTCHQWLWPKYSEI